MVGRALSFLVAILALLVFAQVGNGGRSAGVTLSPDQSPIYEGDAVTFTVVGDDAGWVKTYCVQRRLNVDGTTSVLNLEFPGAWYYPYYGYRGLSVFDVPDVVDLGTSMDCQAHYLDNLGAKGNGGCSTLYYPPILSSCWRTKELGSVAFQVRHA